MVLEGVQNSSPYVVNSDESWGVVQKTVEKYPSQIV